jgi:hypothetical protein
MKNIRNHAAGILFLVSLLLTQTAAYGAEERVPRPSSMQIERVRGRVETLRMWKLTDALDLDEKTASVLFPVVNKFDRERLDVEKTMRKDMRRLRETVDSAREEELSEIIARLKQNHRKLERINEDEMEKLGGILTTRQHARFIIFKQDFDTHIRAIIAEVRGKRQSVKEKPFAKGRP